MFKLNDIHRGDCLELMQEIPSQSVDLIFCDLPYGVTQNKYDKKIPLAPIWEQYKRIAKDKTPVILTSQFPFTIELINSNRNWFRYDLIWNKVLPSGFLNANRAPLRIHEHILVFYKKQSTYNPQFTRGRPSHSKGLMRCDTNNNYGKHGKIDNHKIHGNYKFPISILTFQKPHPSKARHRTEKPIELLSFIIKTYSNKGDLVLDNCMGSGVTAIACKMLNRNFIGIEINPKYCRIAQDRLSKTKVIR